ncbi:Hypothetical_protein [Hexamita inflata]|uniref:Hypothetical_protein n=1 Tax=Hexamita inflata TaxID=28002 RepID=A0AA86R9X5_9EUKA|nr:Hypothetical protein HINF_LOCUS56677 [Hexamita inflata]
MSVSGNIQTQSYFGLINDVQHDSQVIISSFKYQLHITVSANNCAFFAFSNGQWKIAGLVFVGFIGYPLAPRNPIVGQCDCLDGQYKLQGICYEQIRNRVTYLITSSYVLN